MRQRADFIGNNRKAAPGITRAGRLDPGVERQQIGLKGDPVDYRDDLADLLCRAMDVGHRGHRFAHDFAAFHRIAMRLLHRIVHMPGIDGGLSDTAGKRRHGSRSLFQAGSLVLGAHRQIIGGLTDFLRPAFNLARIVGNIAQRGADLCPHRFEIALQILVTRRQALQPRDEIAIGHHVQCIAQRTDHACTAFGFDFKIRGQRDFHVEQRHLDQAADRMAKPPAQWTETVAHHRLQHIVEHRGIGADVPARLKPDAGMHASDLFRRCKIGLIGRTRKHAVPMFDLFAPGMVDNRARRKHARRLGRLADPLIQPIQRMRTVPAHGLFDPGEVPEVFRSQAEKGGFGRGVLLMHQRVFL